MKVSNSRDQIQFAELSKLIKKMKVRNIHNYNMRNSDEAVNYGRSIKLVRRKLGIGQGKIYALKDNQRNIISTFDDIMEAAEELYTDLYRIPKQASYFHSKSEKQDTEVPSITSDEVRKALQDMTLGKSGWRRWSKSRVNKNLRGYHA